VLAELGYSDDDVDELLATRVAAEGRST
jgi:hypothetical protein